MISVWCFFPRLNEVLSILTFVHDAWEGSIRSLEEVWLDDTNLTLKFLRLCMLSNCKEA